MDSRIREIEQWIAEAKSDLGECGREAYLRKLYLLDAEIKAVLKDNHGILPETASPRFREKRVRRFPTPSLALAGMAGVLLLTASTVYLTPLLLAQRAPHPGAGPASSLSVANADRGSAGRMPSLPAGEVLVTDDWRPPVSEVPSQSTWLLADAAASAATTSATTSLLAAGKPAGQKAPAAVKPAPGGNLSRTSLTGNAATAVVMLAGLPSPGSRPVKVRPTATRGSSSSFGAYDAIISHEAGYPSEEEFRQDFAVNLTKEKTKQAAKTSTDGQLPAEVVLDGDVNNVNNKKSTEDGDVDKLDADALKATLEKPFNR
jgi:hypothetical protein